MSDPDAVWVVADAVMVVAGEEFSESEQVTEVLRSWIPREKTFGMMAEGGRKLSKAQVGIQEMRRSSSLLWW